LEVSVSIPRLLDRLEAFYGAQEPCWPVDPYEFIVWWHCGYPQSDLRCARGWEALQSQVGVQPRQILAASQHKLTNALKAGGMVPELRAARLRQIAERVVVEYGGDLRALFSGPMRAVRAALKRFHGIADPGADRILLFGRGAHVAAVPSNCPHVLVRIVHGAAQKNYGATYRAAQEIIHAQVPDQFHARQRAFLIVKAHGQQICKAKPQCARCPVCSDCAYAAGVDRAGSRRA